MSKFVIDAKQLTMQFGDYKAINALDLQVEQGTIYGFLGPNGCGKTTAIRMLTGLLSPTAGSVNVLGFELPAQAEALKLHVGYMTQKFALYDDLTVLENLRFVARIYGLSRQAMATRVDELLENYDLRPFANQLAGTMSGGQKQRLGLAAAIIHKPKLLFLDEPTSAVDPQNRRDFWQKLFQLCEQGASILVSTHYMDEAERCHKLAILKQGVKRADGSPDELMAQMTAWVYEVEGELLGDIKQCLVVNDIILSVAQLGSRLRVLVAKSYSQPEQYLNELLQEFSVKVNAVRPNLEDVFVTCTSEGLA
ncbi:ABC transporter ATP-binding protein [Pseudoalteromonas tunicata]|jgi:ABC-2 type transport system ATP-binding protein|uniref:Putative ATP-binding component of a transport system n=1 Tax=Pseudoalteromonas tunicata D2 TaxID=87626 RepID=A4CEZ9_9GAMM|nr:ABC transporter ATP-binding protein [Pseudoalteromonas tunicata]ATC96139.1 ABC-2 type transport system ATP-binding protein [Pseudoalteromonas tunicata]AXT31658.1 ABC transporter ATP-binding protein [Pseudoalteromonas tunicata]EAR26674.1 putative ATP-binding component of a transport system [Pseudoalteromonas tunicata D2]